MFKSLVLFVCAVGLLAAVPSTVLAEEAPSLALPARAEKQIQEALDKPTSLEFIDSPLMEVLDVIEANCGIDVRIDSRALEDLGVQTDEPITIDIRGISLRSALRLMLRDLELIYVIKDEVLLIMTVDEAVSQLTTRVYPVRDLVNSGLQNRTATVAPEKKDADFDSLIGLLISTIQCRAARGASDRLHLSCW